MSRARFTRCILLFGMLMAIIAPLPAHAINVDNMFPTQFTSQLCNGGSVPPAGTFCRTDNRALTRGVEISITIQSNATINSVMANFYEPTVLTTSVQSPPVYTGSAETDIIYQIRGDIPSGNVAYTWCDNPASQELCDQHYVAFTSNNVTTQGVVCHETGHAVGLTHGVQADPQLSNTDPLLGCMQRPTSSTLVLGAHNTQIINSTY